MKAEPLPNRGALAANPLRDGAIAARAGQNGANDGRQHGHQRMSPSSSAAGIGNLSQSLQQIPCQAGIYHKNLRERA